MQKEFEEKIKHLNEDSDKKKLEIKMQEEMKRMKREEEDRERRDAEEKQKIVRKQAEQADLERRLGVILPLVNEANLIAKELKRDIRFNVSRSQG